VLQRVMSNQGRGRARRFGSVVAVGALMSLLLVACGGGGASPQEEVRLKMEGAAHVHKEERLRRLEKELRRTESPSSSSSTPSTPARESCGGELEVNSYTTCPFAENVQSAYFSEVGSGGGNVEAWSPVTEQFYVMYCTGSPHECTGGNNAAVYFP
jgi:hypothetical protein